MPPNRDPRRQNLDLFLDEPSEAQTPLRMPVGAEREDHVLSFVALSCVKGLGRQTLGALLERYPDLTATWTADEPTLQGVLRSANNRQAGNVAETIVRDRARLFDEASEKLEEYRRLGVNILFRADPEFPRRLREKTGLAWVFVQGDESLLVRQSSVAVVGTREPSAEGLTLAQRATRFLASGGFVIISGLAEGIDAEAHTTALDVGGQTVAVLGHGLGVDFPASNRQLRQRILRSGGALVTEYLWNESYSRTSFVERNRIQAALSGAVVPVECRRKSGTAHTIRFAIEYGRPLFGVRLASTARRDPTGSENDDIYALLNDLRVPVFNVDDREALVALRDFLTPIAGDARPVHEDSPETWRIAYRHSLQQLRSVLRRRGPGPHEVEWLKEILQRIVDDARGAD